MSKDSDFSFNEYFYYKYIKGIVCSPNPSEVIDFLFKNSELNENTLTALVIMTEAFLKYNCNKMDNDMKNNMYLFINSLKKLYKYTDEINNLIILVNKCDDSKIGYAIFDEFRRRFNDNRVALKAMGTLDYSVRLYKNMNVRDLNILITHKFYDDKNFLLSTDIYATESLEYMSSVNMIIYECPNILEDQLLYARVHFVRDRICPNIFEKVDKKTYKKFQKSIK